VPLTESTQENIFDFFEKNLGLNVRNQFKANELGIRRLMLTMTVMAIKNANPNVVVRRVGIIQMAAKANKLRNHYINMQDAVIDMAELLKSPDIKKIFSSDILDVISKPELLNPETYDISYMHWFMHWAKANSERLKPGNQGAFLKDSELIYEKQSIANEKHLNALSGIYGHMARSIQGMLEAKASSRDMLNFFLDLGGNLLKQFGVLINHGHESISLLARDAVALEHLLE
jgi:hypothetical protein